MRDEAALLREVAIDLTWMRPRTVEDAVRELRSRGLSDEAVADLLNSPPCVSLFPAPSGAVKWTPYMIRAHLRESGGQA